MIRILSTLTVIITMLAVGYYLSGGSLGSGKIALNSDAAKLRNRANLFWEDIQFKDFDAAAAHHENHLSETIDISYLVNRLFLVKPELLEILDYEIIYAKIDSSGLRGRVKYQIHYKEFVRNKFGKREIILYFYRLNNNEQWYLKLEDSLRRLTPDKSKIIG